MHLLCGGMSTCLQLVRLADDYSAAAQLSVRTVSKCAAGQAYAIDRLRNGHDITTRRAARIAQWFSDNWPADLSWPADVPRPAPSSGSPAARAAAEAASSSPLALGSDGRIASLVALCAWLGVDRNLADKTVGLYGAGGPRSHRAPRPGSAMREIADALARAGDVRFRGHAERMALAGLLAPGASPPEAA